MEDCPVPSLVIVLNGASSAGKTSVGRSLQRQLGVGWFLLGTDDLLRAAMPFEDDPELVMVANGGVVQTTDVFRQAEATWYRGLAQVATGAPGLIVDEVLLEGGTSQKRLCSVFADLSMFWVGVVCDLKVGLARERLRRDRVPGMHLHQRELVHEGMAYDYVLDTTSLEAEEAAQDLLLQLKARRLV